jgi:hypothetical protein
MDIKLYQSRDIESKISLFSSICRVSSNAWRQGTDPKKSLSSISPIFDSRESEE